MTSKKIIYYPCGYVLRADTEDILIASAKKHARETHGQELTTEQAQAMARPE